LINGVIGAPLDLLKDVMAWVLKKFGFDDTADALKGFSVQDFISRAIDSIFDIFKNVINGIIELAATAIENIPLVGGGIGDKIRSFKFDTNVQERKALDAEIEQARADDTNARQSAAQVRRMGSGKVIVDGKELTGAEKDNYLRDKQLAAASKSQDASRRLEELKAERAALDSGKGGNTMVVAPTTNTSSSSSSTPLISTTPSAMDYSDPMLAGA